MSNKIGQWARFNDNSIMQIKDEVDLIEAYSILSVKVTDTPHALVREKDLIRIKYDCDPSEIEEVRKATGTDFICGNGYHIDFRDVVEILTPSSSGYDSQWKRGE